MPTKRHYSLLPWIALALVAAAAPALRAATSQTVISTASIRQVPAAAQTGTNNPHRPFIKRATLQAAEEAEEITFEVALKMRNFPKLQARVARGETIPFAEMAAKYYPTQEDYKAVRDWVTAQGFKIEREDDNHLAVFASASVANIQKTLKVSFARVSLEGKEYSSAVTAPSIPAAIAPVLLGINGLQPHIQARKHIVQRDNAPAGAGSSPIVSSTNGTSQPYTPAQIAHAYNANGLTVTGSGQSIAIVIDTFPKNSDLNTFYNTYGVVGTGTANIIHRQVVAGTLPNPSGEESLDVEWSSSIAVGAKVRVYATKTLSNANLDTAYQAVFADAVANPALGIHQMSMSYGIGETYTSAAQVTTDSQYFANLASAGITLFASSGDGAFDPSSSGNAGSGNIQVESPTSDPNVTSVGGTSLTLTSGSNINTETGWADGGGGTSIYFGRPTWQVGTGVPAGTTRCCPDVSTPADPNEGAYVTLNGAQNVFGGTSWSSPVWAGFCALINQSRANVNLPAIGLLGPRIYPLIGTTNFHDVTSGNNGYSATAGYDLVTGIGSPNMQNLVKTLTGTQTAPLLAELLPNQSGTFTVASTGTATSYQWQRKPIGSGSWSNIAASGTYSGVTTGTLSVTGVIPEMSGDQFQCLVTTGTVVATTAPPSVLVVDNQMAVTTLAGQALVTGFADGSGTSAQFNYPSGAAIDSAGNVYIADFSANTIRKMTPAGVVTTPYGQAGVTGTSNGTGTAALFNTPNAVAIDGSDNIYVADSGNSTIRKITPAGVVTTLAGSPGVTGTNDGAGSSALFNNPQGIAVDSSGSNVYVTDTVNETVRKIAISGTTRTVSTLAGSAGNGGYLDATGTAAQFNGPIAAAVDASGNVYITDLYNFVIRKITPAGVVTTPYGQAAVAGRTDGIGKAALFNSPIGIAVDASNNIYVTDSQVPPATNSPSSGNNTVRRINPAGVVSTIAGTPGVTGTASGTGPAAQFYSLQSVAVSGSGLVYLCDTFNQTMRAGGLAPLITTLQGTQSGTGGLPVTFSVSTAGSGTVTYQWYFNNVAISGANSSSYTIPIAHNTDAGNYNVTATDPFGTSTSSTYILTVDSSIPAAPPWAPGALGLLFFMVTARFLRARLAVKYKNGQ